MLELELSGEKFNLPMDWSELSLGQYFALDKAHHQHIENNMPDHVFWANVFNILTGIETEKWLRTNEFDVCEKLIPLIQQWTDEPPQLQAKHPMPESLTIGGHKYAVPEKIEMKTWAQKLVYEDMIKKYWQEEQSDVDIDFVPISLSIYLTENFTDIDNVFTEQILKDVKLYDGITVSRFFLTSFILSKKEKMNALAVNTTATNPKPESRNLKSFLQKALSGTMPKKRG